MNSTVHTQVIFHMLSQIETTWMWMEVWQVSCFAPKQVGSDETQRDIHKVTFEQIMDGDCCNFIQSRGTISKLLRCSWCAPFIFPSGNAVWWCQVFFRLLQSCRLFTLESDDRCIKIEMWTAMQKKPNKKTVSANKNKNLMSIKLSSVNMA